MKRFRYRYIIGGTLLLGVLAGVWLSNFLQGIGTGDGIGIGQSGMSGVSVSTTAGPADLGISSDSPATDVPQSLRVVIRDRSYFLRDQETEQPQALSDLVALARSVPGDEDGIKVRVFRSRSARVTAELGLRDALLEADVPESAIFISQDPID